MDNPVNCRANTCTDDLIGKPRGLHLSNNYIIPEPGYFLAGRTRVARLRDNWGYKARGEA